MATDYIFDFYIPKCPSKRGRAITWEVATLIPLHLITQLTVLLCNWMYSNVAVSHRLDWHNCKRMCTIASECVSSHRRIQCLLAQLDALSHIITRCMQDYVHFLCNRATVFTLGVFGSLSCWVRLKTNTFCSNHATAVTNWYLVSSWWVCKFHSVVVIFNSSRRNWFCCFRARSCTARREPSWKAGWSWPKWYVYICLHIRVTCTRVHVYWSLYQL